MPGLNDRDMAFLRDLQRSQTITGLVTEIATFGVTFVDIDGFTAMINIPELSWRPIRHPSDIVTVGQAITAQILDIGLGRGQVSLSLKALQPDPLIDLQRQIGNVIAGPVTKLVPFGPQKATTLRMTLRSGWRSRRRGCAASCATTAGPGLPRSW